MIVQTKNFVAAKTTQTRLKFEKNGDIGVQEYVGKEFAKQTMIDYDGNKDMFVNAKAIVDYDNFMKQQHC